MPEHVTPQCKEILLKILNTKSDQRPTAKEILQDPWFGIDIPAADIFQSTV